MGTVRAVVADPVGRSVVGGWTGTPYACRSKHQREPGYPTVGRCRTGRSALSLVSSEGHRDERRFGVMRVAMVLPGCSRRGPCSCSASAEFSMRPNANQLPVSVLGQGGAAPGVCRPVSARIVSACSTQAMTISWSLLSEIASQPYDGLKGDTWVEGRGCRGIPLTPLTVAPRRDPLHLKGAT